MELLEHSGEIAVETTFLVRIFAVAERHFAIHGAAEGIFLFSAVCAAEIVEDSSVVRRRNGKSFAGKPSALVDSGICTGRFEDFTQSIVLAFGSHDSHIVEILGSGTDK